MEHHGHSHDHDGDESYGIVIGVRIFQHQGSYYLAEAEITPYVDEPEALGATLVFHPLEDLDPTSADEEMEWPAWPLDFDDALTRDTEAPTKEQFRAIVAQMAALSEAELGEYLQQAQEEPGEEEA